jgi:hypothetical protein
LFCLKNIKFVKYKIWGCYIKRQSFISQNCLA